MRQALAVAGLALSLVGSARAEEEVSFMEWIQEVSSAVPPLRMQERLPTAVLPGYFRNARRSDAVVIYDGNASLCRGPDYNRCLPLGNLPTRRTVATTIGGVSKLLVLDSMQSVRVCEVDASDHRATMDCKAVDFTKLADYNMSTLADGKLLIIDGTDGKYACSDASHPLCTHVTNNDGTPASAREFKPLDQPDKTCRVRRGEVRCNDKLSETDDDAVALDDASVPRMVPALIVMEEVVVEAWRDQALAERDHVSRYVDRDAPARQGFWDGSGAYGSGVGPRLSPAAQPPPPPPATYYRQQCLDICAQQDIDYGDACRITSIVSLVFGPVIAGGYYLACEGGRGFYNWRCRHAICGL